MITPTVLGSKEAEMRITDSFAYRTNYDREDGLTARFAFCEIEHYEGLPLWGKGGWRYVFDDGPLLKIGNTSDGQSTAAIIDADGHVKFSKEMPKNDYIYPYKVATDERHDRFVLMVETLRGQRPTFDITGHLVARRVEVLNETGKTLASIQLDAHVHNDTDFSISPDGHRLAILEEGVITVVDL